MEVVDTSTRAEIALLLCCARTHINEQAAERIRHLLHQSIDWTYLIQTASKHQVVPLLYRSLSNTCSDDVPKPILAQLRTHFHANALRNLLLTVELIKLLTVLKQHEIPNIPYKGPVLAASVYGNLALREFVDLDLLVHKRDFVRTQTLLLSHGYQLVQQYAWECSFIDSRGRVCVDLHQGITPRAFPFPLDFERLRTRLKPIDVCGTSIPHLSPEDLLIILCVQVAKDRWEDRDLLAKICDIAELVRAHPSMNWRRVMEEATTLRSQRMVSFGLWLAGNLLGTMVPEEVAQKTQLRALITPLVARARKRLFQEADHSYSDLLNRIRFHFQVQERFQDKLAQLRMVRVKLREWRRSIGPIEIEAPRNAVLSCHPRRVLIVAPQPFYQDRGTPIALGYILKALSDLGYPVDVLTFPLGRSFEIPGVRVFRTPNPLGFRSISVGFSFKKLFLDLLLVQQLRKRLHEERYLCVHAVEEAAFFAAVLCRSQGIFVIYDMASSLPEQLAQNIAFRSRLIKALGRCLERWLLSNVHYVTCSAGLSAYVRSLAPGTPLHEWHFPTTISSVSANEVSALRAELKISEDTKVVLYTGTFAKYQGVEMLIKAIPVVLADRPKTVFVLVGATKAECSTMVQAVGGGLALHVRLLPRQPRDRIECFLALADLLISPRIHGANLPLKIFDYMAAGKPIVATDIPAHRAVLDDTRAVLVPPSAEALAEAVAQILADSERAVRFGVAARAYAQDTLTWPRFMDSMSDIYRQVHAYARAQPRCLPLQ